MECKFFATHKGGRDIDIGCNKYLTFRKGKDGKEFGICSNWLSPTKTTTNNNIVKDIRGDDNSNFVKIKQKR